MKKLLACATLAVAALVSACATGFVPDCFNDILNTSVYLSNDQGHGTGTVIAGNLVLTARHVADIGELTVTFHDGTTRHAVPRWSSDTVDAAVMEFDGPPIKKVATIDCKPVQYGEPVQWVGNPSILRENYNRGFVSEPNAIEDNGVNTGMVALNALLNPGDSGSGMFDDNGNLRGVGVAFLITRIGPFSSQSGNALMVPASAFCTDMLSGLSLGDTSN